jgi:hypothetical protein
MPKPIDRPSDRPGARRRPGTLAGRPPSGPHGERVSEYPSLTVRLPRTTKHALVSLSARRGVPIWKLLDECVLAYLETLPAAERRLLAQFAAPMDRD